MSSTEAVRKHYVTPEQAYVKQYGEGSAPCKQTIRRKIDRGLKVISIRGKWMTTLEDVQSFEVADAQARIKNRKLAAAKRLAVVDAAGI